MTLPTLSTAQDQGPTQGLLVWPTWVNLLQAMEDSGWVGAGINTRHRALMGCCLSVLIGQQLAPTHEQNMSTQEGAPWAGATHARKHTQSRAQRPAGRSIHKELSAHSTALIDYRRARPATTPAPATPDGLSSLAGPSREGRQANDTCWSIHMMSLLASPAALTRKPAIQCSVSGLNRAGLDTFASVHV